MSRVVALVVGAALLAGALTACAGGSNAKKALARSIAAEANANAAARSAPPTAPVDNATRAAANRLCASVLTYNAKHPNPYPTLDLLHPDVPTLKKLGAYFAASPFSSAVGQIVKLPVPQQNPGTWTAFTNLLDQLRGESLTQISAALRGDVDAFVATFTPLQAAQQRVSDAAHQVGFTTAESCYDLLHVTLGSG